MFKGRSKCLFFATLIATLYGIYVVAYFSGIIAESSTDLDTASSVIASALVMPHMVVLWIGIIFGWVGFFARKAWGALVSAILYSVSAVLFILYAFFCVPSIVLGFIGYANQRKLNKRRIIINEFH